MVIFTNWGIKYKTINSSVVSYITVNEFGQKTNSNTLLLKDVDLSFVELTSLIFPLEKYGSYNEEIIIYTESRYLANIINGMGISKFLSSSPKCSYKNEWEKLQNILLKNTKIIVKFLVNGRNVFNTECRNLAREVLESAKYNIIQ